VSVGHDSAVFFEFALDADDAEVQRIRRHRLVGVAEGQLSDPECLTRIDLNGETFLIAASSLSVANDEESGQRHINDGSPSRATRLSAVRVRRPQHNCRRIGKDCTLFDV
jgi:hypothetical protein